MNDTNTQPENDQNPDKEPLAAIFDQYAPTIYKYALRLCHDPNMADQIAGDTFAQLLEGFATGIDPRPELEAYLRQTAYRSYVKYSNHR